MESICWLNGNFRIASEFALPVLCWTRRYRTVILVYLEAYLQRYQTMLTDQLFERSWSLVPSATIMCIERVKRTVGQHFCYEQIKRTRAKDTLSRSSYVNRIIRVALFWNIINCCTIINRTYSSNKYLLSSLVVFTFPDLLRLLYANFISPACVYERSVLYLKCYLIDAVCKVTLKDQPKINVWEVQLDYVFLPRRSSVCSNNLTLLFILQLLAEKDFAIAKHSQNFILQLAIRRFLFLM